MTDDRTNDAINEATEAAGGVAASLKAAAGEQAGRVRREAATLRDQAGDKARTLAEDGKGRASGALDGLAELLEDAAGQIDEKLGAQYGGYARQAADTVSGFASSLRDRDVDDLIEDARLYVRKSPAVAIGAAAAIGFVLARVVKSGFDDARRLGTDPATADRDTTSETRSGNDVTFTPATPVDASDRTGGQPL